MAKKVILAIFGGIALVGVLLMITGFAMGGRVVNMTADNGRIMLDTGSERIDAGAAPFWMSNLTNVGYWAEHRAAYATNPAFPQEALSPIAAEPGAGTSERLPFAKSEVEQIELDISAGYVVITQGDAFSLTVDGPIRYESHFADGEWEITSDHDIDRFRVDYSGSWDGKDLPRFYDGNKDMTTVFYVTVPKGNYELDAEIDIGYLRADGIDVRRMSLSNNMGLLECSNARADEASFGTDLGECAVTGFAGRVCELKVNMGHITFGGEVTELLRAECDLGAIEAKLPRPERYGWDLQADLGSVTLDGKTAAGLSGENSGNAGTTPFFDLECGMGSIDVKFY